MIGRARQPIAAGAHVHSHNLAFEDLVFQYEFPAEERSLPVPPASMPTFQGYLRADGRTGTRNYIAVISTVNCSASVSKYVAARFNAEALKGNILR